MKKTLTILVLFFLVWCNNKEIKVIETKIIEIPSEEVKIIEKSKDFNIIEVEWDKEEYIRLDVRNFSDDKYREFKKYKNVQSFHIEIFMWKKWIEKTLSFIRDNFFKWNLEYNFTLEDYEFDFTNKEIKIFSQMNISYLWFMWIYPHISFPNLSDEDKLKYKKEKTHFDDNINYILNHSKTINKIIVQDYKTFVKKDWKIEIQDLRINRERLQELWL